MKQCKKCSQLKQLSDFPYSNGYYENICRICKNKNSTEWRKRNPKKIKIARIKYLKKKKDKYGLGAGTIGRYGFRLALMIYEKFNRQCYICGNKYDLTIHHLDNKGRNYENRKLKPNNSENNLVLLCRKCHGGIHGRERRVK